MIVRQQPSRPFQHVACDLLNYGNKYYLVLVDMYSKWIELVKLPSKTASAVIAELKKIFPVHGIPVKVFVDNNPYNSLEFKLFAKSWGFEPVYSSPHYHQSNGLAEKAVGICKSLLKK